MWYNPVKGQRVYISVYFGDAKSLARTKGDITLAFDASDSLCHRAKSLGSSGIKRIIGISTYHALLEAAKSENRPLGNLIKHRLTLHFGHE